MGKDGSPVLLADTGQRAHDKSSTAQQRVDTDVRRLPPRRRSLRRVKDSKEELRRTRSRGASQGTIESSPVSSSAPSGQSFTVGNINRGIIYLRYVVVPVLARTAPCWRVLCAELTNTTADPSCAQETSATARSQIPSSSRLRRRPTVPRSNRRRSPHRGMTGTTARTARAQQHAQKSPRYLA